MTNSIMKILESEHYDLHRLRESFRPMRIEEWQFGEAPEAEHDREVGALEGLTIVGTLNQRMEG